MVRIGRISLLGIVPWQH